MKLDIDGIQAFVRVAELGGFYKAADKLNLSQTALTRRIQKLEAYLGLRLLDRTTRSVALTAVGREFLPQAARLVEELSQSVDRLKDMSRWATGDVAIACVPSMAHQQLPAVIRAYAEKYPGNRVRLIDRNSAQVAEAVRNGEAELGIHIRMRTHPELIEQTLLHDPFVLFCRADHPASTLKRITWKALRGIDLIAVSGSSGNRVLLDHQLARHKIDLRGRCEVEHRPPPLRWCRRVWGPPSCLSHVALRHASGCAPRTVAGTGDSTHHRSDPPPQCRPVACRAGFS